MTGHAVQSVHTQSARYPYAFDYTSQLTGLCGAPIARGGYSVVRKCYLYGEPVAVKELKANVGCLPMSEMAEREYELWHPLKHPNILPLKGICYLCPDRKVPSFISSWQKNGRINDYVRGVPEADFLRLIEDIAEGVRYLHDNGIIHGDLRAANVLISDDHRALVTDFGLAKYDSGDGVQISKAFQGNFRWMACEFFKCEAREFPAREARRSKESDVWMFAMLMQEILSGKIPFHEYKNVFSIASMIGAGRLPVFPSAQHRSWAKFDKPVRDLCSRCCTSEPKKRPTIVAILKEIRKATLEEIALIV